MLLNFAQSYYLLLMYASFSLLFFLIRKELCLMMRNFGFRCLWICPVCYDFCRLWCWRVVCRWFLKCPKWHFVSNVVLRDVILSVIAHFGKRRKSLRNVELRAMLHGVSGNAPCSVGQHCTLCWSRRRAFFVFSLRQKVCKNVRKSLVLQCVGGKTAFREIRNESRRKMSALETQRVAKWHAI